MEMKTRKSDEKYKKLTDGINPEATYRHLSNLLFLIAIPLVGNIASLIVAIKIRINKGYVSSI